MRGYPARRLAEQAKALARSRLRAVAVDGKTSRGARRADGTLVHLLGVAEHGGHLLDHIEVGVKHNETSHFTELLDTVELNGAVVTSHALYTVRANLDWLVTDTKPTTSRSSGISRCCTPRSGRCPGGRSPAVAAPATEGTGAPRPAP